MKAILRTVILTTLAATALLSAGCCDCRSYQKRTRRPLVGTQWQLIQLEGRNVKAQPESYLLTFEAEGNRLTGVGACNRLMGSYTLGERRALTIGPVATTRMACPTPNLEAQFLEAVEATTHYDMDGPMLLLLSNGELRAVFEALP